MPAVFICHECNISSEPFEGARVQKCDRCGRKVDHFISWNSPDEEEAAALLIERELLLKRGGWGAEWRTQEAVKDAAQIKDRSSKV